MNPERLKRQELREVEKAIIDALPLKASDKAKVVLVLAGLKPTDEIMFYTAMPEWGNQTVVSEEEIESWSEKLKRLGFFVKRALPSVENGYVQVPVSFGLDRGQVERLTEIHNECAATDNEGHKKIHLELRAEELGRLYGFPETATHAFMTDRRNNVTHYDVLHNTGKPIACLPHDEYPENELLMFSGFRLSKSHWKEEIKVVQEWADTVRYMYPELYQEIVEPFRQYLAAQKK